MALFSTVMPPSPTLASTLFHAPLCLLILAFFCYLNFFASVQSYLKNVRSTSAIICNMDVKYQRRTM